MYLSKKMRTERMMLKTTKEKQSPSKRMEKSFHSQLRFRHSWIKTSSENLSFIMARNILSAVKKLLKNQVLERQHLIVLWQFLEPKRQANSKKCSQSKIFMKKLKTMLSSNNSSKERTITSLNSTIKR